MEDEKFGEIVSDAVSDMPDEFKELLDNVNIFIEDWPTREQLKSVGLRNKNNLLGLYEGIPRTNRGQNYNLVLPDRITIFKKPLERQCNSVRELKQEIIKTVKHEIAHYFGIDDDRLSQIENGNQP